MARHLLDVTTSGGEEGAACCVDGQEAAAAVVHESAVALSKLPASSLKDPVSKHIHSTDTSCHVVLRVFTWLHCWMLC